MGPLVETTKCGKGLPSMVTRVMKDALFCVEGHWEVTGVGDLDDVGSDVTKDDVAKVQDILWQLDSEMINELSLPVSSKSEIVTLYLSVQF